MRLFIAVDLSQVGGDAPTRSDRLECVAGVRNKLMA
jgi:hypothetical protein